jgi:hypothetical protein
MLDEIYYEVDEFNQKYLEKIALYAADINWFKCRKVGCMSMSEIMTILIFYHYSHYKDFKNYYTEYVSKNLKRDFPQLVGYDRFVWYIPMALLPMLVFHLYRCSLSRRTGIYYIDSTRLEACHPKRAHQHKVFKGFADWGKTSVGWFYGIKIHLIINHLGEVVHTCFSKGSTPDTHPKILFNLLNDISGWVFGDKGYLMNDEKLVFAQHDDQVIFCAKDRKNVSKAKAKKLPVMAKLYARKRPIIETTIGIQKNVMNLEHSRHRSPWNAYVHCLAAMCAYSFYQRKPKANINLSRVSLNPPKTMFLKAA